MVDFRKYLIEDRDWVISSNARHYRTVEGFDPGFGDVVASALDHLEQQVGDERSYYIVAEDEEHRVGCIFFSAEDDTSGRVRLFFLTDAYRGHGIGKRMLHQVIERARRMGFKTIRVSTFEQHRDACGLYAATGFQGKISEPFEVFGQLMRQIDFELNVTQQTKS